MDTKLLLVIIIILLLVSNVAIPVLNAPLLVTFGRSFSIMDFVVIGLLIWLTRHFGSPLREIMIIILMMWLLSALGVFAFISWFPNILLLAIFLIILLTVI